MISRIYTKFSDIATLRAQKNDGMDAVVAHTLRTQDSGLATSRPEMPEWTGCPPREPQKAAARRPLPTPCRYLGCLPSPPAADVGPSDG